MPVNEQVDVAILGGGPAGTSTAIALARKGLNVAVLERSRYEAQRVGETLPPKVRMPLEELGLWQKFLADEHVPSQGIISAWGSSELYENNFLFNPYGNGWHINRRQFDEMLALASEQAGARLYRSIRVNNCTKLTSKGWSLEVLIDRQPIIFKANFLVDATGRASSPLQRFKGKKTFYDNLLGIWEILQVSSFEQGHDNRTLIEASHGGWWYSALLPDDKLALAYMTDADQIVGVRRRLADFWQEQLRLTQHTRLRVKASIKSSNPRIVSARSYKREHVIGPDYLAVGDAAVAFDPLTSQGIYNALLSGLISAAAIEEYLRDDYDKYYDYARELEKNFDEYLQLRIKYYSLERRWRESKFWCRRQHH
jgi:flavin-dependent dehydrogenase